MKSLRKGFTLVELMVVIVIIGILAALAIPRFLGATNKAKATEFKPVLKQIYTLETAYQQERNDGLYGSLSLIGWDPPGFNGPVLTATATSAYFAYAIGNAPAGVDIPAQRAAITANPNGIAIAVGNSLGIASPNANGVASLSGANGLHVINGTDNVCVLTTGDMRIPAAAITLATIAGSIAQGACP